MPLILTLIEKLEKLLPLLEVGTIEHFAVAREIKENKVELSTIKARNQMYEDIAKLKAAIPSDGKPQAILKQKKQLLAALHNLSDSLDESSEEYSSVVSEINRISKEIKQQTARPQWLLDQD